MTMSTVPAKPLPEIKENDAKGHIAALYDDIRAVIGVPMINLIFRHMATVPGCLDWAWATTRPLYLSGAIPKAAAALTESILPGQTADLTGPISAAGLSTDDIDGMSRVLDSYGRANPMNLVGLKVIDLALDQMPQDDTVGQAPAVSDEMLLTPEGMPDLLPMIDPTTAPDRTRGALSRLARQIHGGDTGVIPSLYRHFGAWPDFLEELESALEPTLSGGIEDAAQSMLADGERRAEIMYRGLALSDMPPPDGQATATLKHLIGQFPPNICRLTVLATLLKRGLPATAP